MNFILKSCFIISISFLCLVFVSCNKDDIDDPYQPENLPKLQQLKFFQANDSSIFTFDEQMRLVSGWGYTKQPTGKESFTLNYTTGGQLDGAAYEVLQGIRNQSVIVAYARNDRGMLSKITRDDWADNKTIILSYDNSYRLMQITLNAGEVINRYTITYSQSNVSSVEIYKKVLDVEGTTKEEYTDFDIYQNPCRFLVNAFYAPAFSSAAGPFRYDAIPLGILLSANNPGKIVTYKKNSDGIFEMIKTSNYQYEYNDDHYPLVINGDTNLEIAYIK